METETGTGGFGQWQGCQIGREIGPIWQPWPVAIFLLLSISSSKGQKYSGEMHLMPRRQVSFNVCQVNEQPVQAFVILACRA